MQHWKPTCDSIIWVLVLDIQLFGYSVTGKKFLTCYCMKCPLPEQTLKDACLSFTLDEILQHLPVPCVALGPATALLRRAGWHRAPVRLGTVGQLSEPLPLSSTTWRHTRPGGIKKTRISFNYKNSYLEMGGVWLGLSPSKRGQFLVCRIECGRCASVKSDVFASWKFLCRSQQSSYLFQVLLTVIKSFQKVHFLLFENKIILLKKVLFNFLNENW